MGKRKYLEATGNGMVIASAVYQDIKDTSQNVIYVRSELRIYILIALLIHLCSSYIPHVVIVLHRLINQL